MIRPDTVHALGFNAAFIGAVLKPFFKFKLIVTPLALYDFNDMTLRNLAIWVLKRADVIFVESEISRDNISSVCDPSKVRIFTHWVDTSKFYPIEYKMTG